MKERILSRWSFLRILWLVMGVGITIQAITERNFLMLLPGIYFVFGSLANIGCFAGSCATGHARDDRTQKERAISDVEYEEVGPKN